MFGFEWQRDTTAYLLMDESQVWRMTRAHVIIKDGWILRAFLKLDAYTTEKEML